MTSPGTSAGSESTNSFNGTDRLDSALQTEELISVGPDDDGPLFKVQKQLLLDASDYFKTALSGPFQEASQHRIRLPGTDLQTTKLFVWWICRRSLPPIGKEFSEIADQCGSIGEEHVAGRLLPLFRLWLLGDQLIIPALQNKAMATLLSLLRWANVSCADIEECYRMASSSPQLKSVVIVEARYEYFERGALEGADLDVLGRIPGFMADFVNGKGTAHTGKVEHEQFMVA